MRVLFVIGLLLIVTCVECKKKGGVLKKGVFEKVESVGYDSEDWSDFVIRLLRNYKNEFKAMIFAEIVVCTSLFMSIGNRGIEYRFNERRGTAAKKKEEEARSAAAAKKREAASSWADAAKKKKEEARSAAAAKKREAASRWVYAAKKKEEEVRSAAAAKKREVDLSWADAAEKKNTAARSSFLSKQRLFYYNN